MTSKEIKAYLLKHLLYGRGYHAAFTEMRNADVYAITRSKYSHEFEIKVSKGDLMSELNCVKDLTLFGKVQKWYPKHWKHEHYLSKSESQRPIDVPNYFSFVVPFDLEKCALEILKDTKYGVVAFDYHENGGNLYVDFGWQKKAQLLHKDKVNDNLFFYLLRKASTEVEVLRSHQNR